MMARYAQIVNNTVYGVYEYDVLPEFAPNIVMIPLDADSPVQAGWGYENGEFIAPAPEPAPSLGTKITRLAFLNRFADAEAIALDLASQGATVEAATIRRYMAKVNAATFIDLSREDTRQGVEALEASGILDEGRAAEILDNPVEEHEVYKGV